MSRSLASVIFILVFSGLVFWILWPLGLAWTQRAGWGATATGLFAASTWAACFAVLPFAQTLVARLGHRGTVVVSTLLLLSASLGYLFALNDALAWAWAALLGISFGLRWPALDAWAVELTPIHRRGRLLAILETIAGVTMVAGPAIVAALSCSMPAAVAVGGATLGVLVAARTTPPTASPHRLKGVPVHSLAYRSPPALAVLGAALCGGLFESGFMASAPMLAQAEGLSMEHGLWVAALVGTGSVAVQFLLGFGADRFGAVRVLAPCAAGLAVAFLLLAIAPNTLTLASFVIGGLGGGLYTLAAIHGVQAEGGRSAGAIGAAATAYTAGTLASPALTGLAIDGLGVGGAVAAMGVVSGALWVALSAIPSASGKC